jgi:hypothetical protein
MRVAAALVLCLTCLPCAAAGLADGLLLYLPLDESSGPVASDRSATAASASVAGNAAWAPGDGAFGGALYLAGGRDGGISVAHDYGVLPEATIAAWVRVTDPPAPRWDYVLDTRDRDVAEEDGATYLGRDRDARLRYGDFAANADTYPRGQWTHIAIAVDSRASDLYVDGELVDTWDGGDINVGARLTLGNRHTFTDALHGALDDVALWDRKLNALDVLQIARRPVLPPRATPGAGALAAVWASLRAPSGL